MDYSSYKILIVDDETDILEFLGYNLRKEGFQVKEVMTGKEAIEVALTFRPHLILLDVMMPEMDGIEVCEELKKQPETRNTLIAFLTARGEDYSQIAGFNAGGDDYITKPISPRVLISRIKALLNRSAMFRQKHATGEEFSSEGVYIDKERYVVFVDGVEMTLPRKEFELLALLRSIPEKVFTREEIYQSIWGFDTVVGDRTIDVHIRKLREKVGDKYIKTVKGVGYKFTP